VKPIAKSVLAGLAGAGGAVAVDQYVVQTPPSPNVYYGAAALALFGAYVMRKKPYAVGALGGLAVGAAYRGYMRGAAAPPAPRPVQAPTYAPSAYAPPPAYPYPYPYQYPPQYQPPPPSPSMSYGDVQKYAQQGLDYGKQLAESFGGGTPQSVPYEAPAMSDAEYYSSY